MLKQPQNTHDLDLISKTHLPVLRHFLNTFADPETQAWRQGYKQAQVIWGEARGLAIADATQEFVAALLKSKRAAMSFHDPLDLLQSSKLTADEAAILSLLNFMRDDNAQSARITLLSLTAGRADPAVVQTGLRLALILGLKANWPKTQQQPKLKSIG